MPSTHRQAQWQAAQFLAQAKKHGMHTERLVVHILQSRPVPEQAYRSCLGILRLADKYGSVRLEAAAQCALHSDVPTYKSVAAILKNNLDADAPTPAPVAAPIQHDNIRGADYYSSTNDKENTHA